MRESTLEKHFNKGLKERGALTYKWTGALGCPDRIVFYKGDVFFVELKAPRGCLRPWQKRFHKKLLERGYHVHTLRSKPEIDAWLFVLTSRVPGPPDRFDDRGKSWWVARYGSWQDSGNAGSDFKTTPNKSVTGGSNSRTLTSDKTHMAQGMSKVVKLPKSDFIDGVRVRKGTSVLVTF